MAQAAKIHRQIVPKMNSLFTVPSPAPVKFALNYLGINVGGLRLPLVPCTKAEEDYVLTELNWKK